MTKTGSMSNRNVLIAVLSFLAFLILTDQSFRPIYDWISVKTGIKSVSYVLTYFTVGAPLIVAAFFIYGSAGNLIHGVGLTTGVFKGLAFALICTLPMLIGYALLYPLDRQITLFRLFSGALCAGFFEELYYRGIFFGILYRKTRLGFFPAVIVGALLFASMHLYQSDDIGRMTGIFLTTFLGAGWFAWTFVEWKYNLWVAISLHFLMNAYWMIFNVGEDALGGMGSNIFRVLTILFVILGTIWYKRRHGEAMIVNRNTLWMKENA